MNKSKKQVDGFAAALKTKESCKEILGFVGVAARYILSITDSGPVVEIVVKQADYNTAQMALPYTIGSANVKITKKS